METVKIFDLTRQARALKDEIDQALQAVLETGQFILGSRLEAFEIAFSDYLGCRFAVGVGSGTGALSLAYQAAGLAPGKKILTVPTTYVATAMAAAIHGGIPEFIDIRPDNGRMDLQRLHDRLARARREGTLQDYAAIVPVHLYGHPEDMNGLTAIAGEFGIAVIEDACQAHGAWFPVSGCGKVMAGTAGALGCFSFYPTKNLGAYGDGGMVVTNDPEMAERVRMLRNYGQGEKRHTHFAIAANNRLDEVQAAWLSVKLPHLDAYNRRRREIAAYYTARFAPLPLDLPPREAEGEYAVAHLYVIRTNDRESLQAHLAERGIGTAIHYPIPIHLQPAFQYLGYTEGAFPNAEAFARRVLSLPLYPELTDGEVERVVSAVSDFF